MDFKIISNGYVAAKTYLLKDDYNFNLTTTSPEVELNRFNKAIKSASKDLEKSENTYFIIQKMLLTDPILSSEVNDLIKNKKLTAEAALKATIKKYKENLLNSNSKYLQERIYDLEDICQRLINKLINKENNYPTSPFILVCEELLPSILLEHQEYIKGIIAKKAGFMSHGAIMARSLEIPFITTNKEIPNDTTIIIDTRCNILELNPTANDIKRIEDLKQQQINFKVVEHKGMLLLANVFGNEQIQKVKNYGFDGIGLYRTEFIFMHNDRPLSYAEQLNIYTKAVKTLGEKTFCFRTFDIGDDKQIAYIKTHSKGFLNYVNNEDMFEDQIKALINANIYGKMKIMFPMIETKEEFNYLKSWVLTIKKELNNDKPLKIGMMLETKEALEHIYDFTESDFFSIGTNDLSMQLYHLNRDEVKTIPYKYIIDLKNKLKDVVTFCARTNKELSMCGELAALPEATKLFLDIGLKNFSVSPAAFKDLNDTIANYYKKF